MSRNGAVLTTQHISQGGQQITQGFYRPRKVGTCFDIIPTQNIGLPECTRTIPSSTFGRSKNQLVFYCRCSLDRIESSVLVSAGLEQAPTVNS